MKIPNTLPITAEQSRASRFQLGLTQANVVEESSLPGHKLKNFETGRFVPDMPFLESLRDYYTGKGIDFSESVTVTTQITDQLQPNGQAQVSQQGTPGAAMVRPVSRMCFYVSDDISPDVVNQVLERMDGNDDRIAAIMKEPIKAGFLSAYDERTEALQRELFGAMAENYLLFRLLQGRNIVSELPAGSGPATHADLLSSFFTASPLAAVGGQGKAVKAQPAAAAGDSDSEGGDE
jgi:hypothetical protein